MKYLINIKTNGTEDALQQFYEVINHLDNNVDYLSLYKFENWIYRIIIACSDCEDFIKLLSQLSCIVRCHSLPIMDDIGTECEYCGCEG